MSGAVDVDKTPPDGGCALVVSGDATLRRMLELQLGEAGWTVLEAADGRRGLELLHSREVDVVLVDLTVPDVSGLDLVRHIRQETAVPVLLLTPGAGRTVEVAGLDLGAEDTTPQPFSMSEVARVAAAHLGTSKVSRPVLRHGDIHVDVEGRRCRIGDEEIELAPREFDLLTVLLRHPEETLSRQALLEQVWRGEEVTERTVDVHVSALRRKLGAALALQTVRGVGYRLRPR